MIESYPLITNIVISVVFAFLLGLLANRLHLPTILGYLLAGVLIGPNTPGFIADIHLAKQLAEIGVILLMFGVGLHFSVSDLTRVHKTALPGALIQLLITTLIGLAVAMLLNHNFFESLVFGLTLSVASTVVLLRSLEQYRLLDKHVGKVAIGWLIVEDIAMVIVVVLLPILSQLFFKSSEMHVGIIFESLFLVLLKISAFVIIMLLIGRKALPQLLMVIAKTKSRELMSLGILAISSGFAFVAYTLFGTSFALGAFMAGFVLNEGNIGKQSVENYSPLSDIFSVLFFVSAGMLFNPAVITEDPTLVLTALLLVVFGKALIAYFIMRTFRQSVYNSLILAVSLAQIGEFSFILTALALKLEIFSHILYDMVIASAIISITLNPFLFKLVKRFKPENS